MPINFPTNPTIGQNYSFSGRTWQWTGEGWKFVSSATGFTGSAGFTGSQGPIGYAGSASEATSVTISPAFKGALLTTNASQTLATASWTTLTNFDTVVYDTSNFVSVADRFTIPAGVTKVKLSGAVTGSNATDQFISRIIKNGAETYSSGLDNDTSGGDASLAITPVLSVVANDYFQIQAYSTTAGRSVGIDPSNWFTIEVVEGSILDTTSTIRTTGYTGSAGVGFTGSVGSAGFTGSQGAIGYTGSKGDIGFTGSSPSTGKIIAMTIVFG
jgi:hypothetical protein